MIKFRVSLMNLNERLSRRDFLKKGSTVTVGAALARTLAEPLENSLTAPFEQRDIYQESLLPPREFLERNADALKYIKIGATFSPEQIGVWPGQKGQEREEKQQNALYALGFMIENLGIKEIRFSMRWNNLVNQEGDISFSFYMPFLKFLLSRQDISVALELGGIKSARWPEEHVPVAVLSRLPQEPLKNAEINSSEPLGKEALNAISTQCRLLKQALNAGELSRITILQPENEPFNGFGEKRWTMSDDYLLEAISLVHEAFPDKKILFNSAGVSDLGEIQDLYKNALEKNPELKFILGYDHYPNHPGSLTLPGIGKTDPVFWANMQGNDPTGENRNKSKKIGYEIEITELQMEPWGDRKPGNTIQIFHAGLLRCLRNILNTNESSIVRVWGIEYQLEQLRKSISTREQQQALWEIREINLRSIA